ncbi:hypothetical protein Arub01_29300 [Actinomadura rubrobrunea]|uniref:Uncharacterized protein n=1 Tax=Actinomadura rubrobrunea TaxID=115335 RepID=A0A9W6PXB3_9ACTN|nr:hypothetical protein [Actinomadura rubrobrunea]GLW64686.1 hypothetical protein Arub01_29300 [Actinomadura rubrobrunea]
MGADDDFALWEQELRCGQGADAAETRGNQRGMFVMAALTSLGCTAMILIGQTPLGVAGLLVVGLIMLLWRTGW